MSTLGIAFCAAAGFGVGLPFSLYFFGQAWQSDFLSPRVCSLMVVVSPFIGALLGGTVVPAAVSEIKEYKISRKDTVHELKTDLECPDDKYVTNKNGEVIGCFNPSP